MRYLGKSSVSSFLEVFLKVVWALCLFGLVAILGGALVVALVDQARLAPGPGSRFSLDLYGISLHLDSVKTVVRDPRAIILGLLVFAFFMLGFATAIVYQLRRIFANLKAGQPFIPENARRIRAIGLLVILACLVQSFLGFGLGTILAKNLAIEGVTIRPQLNFGLDGFLIGLVILVLAEVFRYGAALQEDRDLTV